jgi:hypothetical protein
MIPDIRFSRPIPGQSLTDTPKNAAWERPPEINDPELALQVHLARLNDEKVMSSAMQNLEMGMDLVSLTEGILRSAVSRGIHSIDVSIIIAPAIHEFIKITADELGIEYDEGFEDPEQERVSRSDANATLTEARRKEAKAKAKKLALREASPRKQRELPLEEVVEEVVVEEKPRGLMARGN